MFEPIKVRICFKEGLLFRDFENVQKCYVTDLGYLQIIKSEKDHYSTGDTVFAPGTWLSFEVL